MEECEALSNRIGIMVNSRLKCLGTAQHLKSKFGSGFQIALSMKNEESESQKDKNTEDILEYLGRHFQTQLIERHNLNLNIRITAKEAVEEEKVNGDGKMALSEVFEKMEAMKQELPIQSYGVSQTKLEQIFLMMAKQGGDEEAEEGAASE